MLAAAVATLCPPASAQEQAAATHLWTGGANGNWDTGTNWSLGREPVAGDTANIFNGNGPLVTSVGNQAGILNVGGSAQGGTLAISGAGALTVGTRTILGQGVGQRGVGSVTGPNALFTGNQLNIAEQGTGEFTASGGASITATTLNLGLTGTDSNGSLTVTDAGSRATISGIAQVGKAGAGAVNVLAGARLTSNNSITIGVDAGANGAITIDGAGSMMTTTSPLTVGSVGSGALNVRNGGSLTAQGLVRLALNAGSTGTLNVDGGTMNVGGALNIGVIGAGTATIENGASVTGGSMVIASANATTRGTGDLRVDNATLTVNGAMTIGGGGAGTLVVNNGDIVSGTTTIGGGAIAGASMSTATIAGPNASWTMGGLTVGGVNAGQLLASGGATLNSVGAGIGTNTGAGFMKLDNIAWNASNAAGTAVIGVGDGNIGALELLNGSSATTSNRLIVGNSGGAGTMLVDNSSFTLLPQTAGVQANVVEIGRNGATGTLTVQNGSAVVFNNAQFQLGTRNTSSQGTLLVQGAGTTITSEAFVVGQNGAGHFQLLDGAAMNTGFFVSGANSSAIAASDSLLDNATLNITSDGVTPGARLGSRGSASLTIQNGGAMNITGGDMEIALLAGSSGTLTIGGTGGTLNVAQVIGGTLNVAAGDIEIEDLDGSSGTLADGGSVDVLNGGVIVPGGAATVNFDHTNAAQIFTPAMRGYLTLNQLGSGVTILTSDSDFIGVTTISDGVLQMGNGAGGGMIINSSIVNNADLVSDLSDTHLYNGVISGSGDYTQNGTGTIVFANDQAYTGATSINAGTLQLGVGAAAGSVVGDIRNDASLIFNRSDVHEYGGVISGVGRVTVAGGGTLILTGDNTYGGDTTISAGALRLGDGGATGSVAGDILNNTSLTINRSNLYAYGGVISGPGRLTVDGGGTFALSRPQAYTGATDIISGTLRADVADVIASTSLLTIASSGTFFLNGFDQHLTDIFNAGTIIFSPEGAAPGTTLTVDPYVGQSGSLVLNTVLGDDNSPSDRLVMDGGRASGTTGLVIRNVGGLGAVTQANGIPVVQGVNGGVTDPGAFALRDFVVAGPYEYLLYRGGSVAGAANDWFLRSTIDCNAPGATIPPCPAPLPPSPPDPPPLPPLPPDPPPSPRIRRRFPTSVPKCRSIRRCRRSRSSMAAHSWARCTTVSERKSICGARHRSMMTS